MIILLTCVTVLLLASAGLVINELRTYRGSAVSDLTETADLIGGNSTAALTFNNPDDAREILATLKKDQHMLAACIYNKQNMMFASYARPGTTADFPPEPPAEAHHFSRNRLNLTKTIFISGKPSGAVYLVQDLEEMYTNLINYSWLVGLLLLVSIVVALLIATRLQRMVSGPILELTAAAREISECNNYSLRVAKRGRDESGQLVEAFNYMLDQIQARDTALQEARADLERHVAERTAQLEAANKELEAFSYSVSHDLRAPLRSINGYTSILLEDYVPHIDAEGKRICAVICESARKMGLLIDDLLAFSRIGRMAVQPSNVDMATMVRSIFMEVTTPESGKRIDFHVDPLPVAVADPNLIRQVWTNLLLNAVKFSSKKVHAVIKVSARQSENETVYSVQDNGAGFDMQYVDKLFGVFQRLHSIKEFEGTGCGLAIVERIIKRHGGRVWAEAETDKGATFYFTLHGGDSAWIHQRL